MTTVLAIDTSSAQGSIALRVNGNLANEQDLDAQDGFADVLFPAIETLLRQCSVPLSAVDCFAVISGPGAFTGLRVGLTAAKGLAEASGKFCAAISTLRVLASTGTRSNRAVLMDARRGQVYAAVYDEALRLVSAETVTHLNEWIACVPDTSEFIAPLEFHAAIRSLRPDAILTSPPLRLAAALARCAECDEAAGGWTDPAAVDANYVRRSDAEMAWREF